MRGWVLALALSACAPSPGNADDVCAAEFAEDPIDPDVRTIGVQVPDDAGGSVHVDVRWPAAVPPAASWPVALLVHGAWDAAGTPLGPASIRPDVNAGSGLVGLHLDLPGPGRTGGTDDRRGALSRAAVAAALRWAGGTTTDTGGCTLAARTLGADPDDLYVIGTSNGGNLAVATLADPALDLPDLAGLVTWETPTSPQFATVELGADPSVYMPGTCTLTAAGIVCPIPADILVAPIVDGQPVVCFDRDGDDACGPGDVTVRGVEDPVSGLWMLSPTLTGALADRGLAVPGYADLATATAWWAERDAAGLAGALVAAQPDLPVLLLASEEDHVQTLADHPHVFGFGEALQAAGAAWTRLNPGVRWLPDNAGENQPNAPLTLADPVGVLLPEQVEDPAPGMLASAIRELAEHRSTGEW
jgi:alpha-beta hydrolase superfamily lysophospholipase